LAFESKTTARFAEKVESANAAAARCGKCEKSVAVEVEMSKRWQPVGAKLGQRPIPTNARTDDMRSRLTEVLRIRVPTSNAPVIRELTVLSIT